jgi:lipopolysaccharide transport system ATP-binding protein
MSDFEISMDFAIKAEVLSKLYRIGQRESYRTLRDTITNAFTAPLRTIRHLHSSIICSPSSGKRTSGFPGQLSAGNSSSGTFWALKNVSFEVKPGEVVGIIGRNGAGKTTLLKILSRITEPTEGCADISGRVGALLEVGTGFHPELTGRENVYLNGAILGMSRVEIGKKFSEIIEFAEMNTFIDTPVKHYSSGMYIRLAFAVAAHLDPEILLVDEVLAVGDVKFQRKCLGKMNDVALSGRTVLFVSHNLGAIRQLCGRAIWIDQGSLVADGEANKVVTAYLDAQGDEISVNHLESEYLRIEKVVLSDGSGKRKSVFCPGEDLEIEIHYFAKKAIASPFFWINVIGQYGPLFGANMLFDGNAPDSIEGMGIVTCTLRNMPLLPQAYTIRMGVRGDNGVTFLIKTTDVAAFSVDGRPEDMGWTEERAGSLMGAAAPVFIPYDWKLPDGKVVSVKSKWARKHGKVPARTED